MTATRDEVNSVAQSPLNDFCTGRVMMMIAGFSTGKLPAQVLGQLGDSHIFECWIDKYIHLDGRFVVLGHDQLFS